MKFPKIRKIVFLGLSLSVVLVLITAGSIFLLSRTDPNNQFTKEGIRSILSRESVVYYADGTTPLGTFFEGTHRKYIEYDSIPETLIQAIISAEDKNFFKHSGVDYKAILVAIADDLRSFSLKRGGSSLTQQTAKNLFPAAGRGKVARLKAKIPELINAYRLERNFTKEEILEFYLNQFYVSGNGHGIGIAARYFFGKDISDLGLIELAFIAGSVKGPNKYNPFKASSKEMKSTKLQRAHERVHYVLLKMKENGFLTPEAYESAITDSIPFSKGQFRYKLSTNIVKVKQFLESDDIAQRLENFGVSQYETSGLKIVTTLDANLQRASEYATYKNLSQLSLILEGYLPPADKDMDLVPKLEAQRFHTGKICSTIVEKGIPTALQVQFGSVKGWIDKGELDEFLKTWNRHQTGLREQPSKAGIQKIMGKHFAKDKLVLCAVKKHSGNATPKKGNLEIMQTPTLQGGSRILKNGRIIANVGGFQNTGYDRVNQAVRQFGSTYKPLVYAAALDVGWHPLDTLLNYRQMFKMGPTFYFPRPNHEPEPYVSLAWAGKLSENIASVYLLYHMMDKLSFSEFWEHCKTMGIHPDNFDDEQGFIEKVRDSLGINMTTAHLKSMQYKKIVEELATDLVFDEKEIEAAYLKKLPYGNGFKAERKKYQNDRTEEGQVRLKILKECFLDMIAKVNTWDSTHVYLNSTGDKYSIFTSVPDAGWQSALSLERDPEIPIYVNGKVNLEILQELQKRLDDFSIPDQPYSTTNLYFSSEFKAMVSIMHTIDLAKKSGIHSNLEPVLSFPLGSNVITLSEATEVYQTLKTGMAYKSEKTGASQLFVEKIVLPSGKIIFQDELKSSKVITDKVKYGVRAVLRAIVDIGTGAKVMRKVRIRSAGKKRTPAVAVQCYGKTGTTNDHRNGAFLGHIAGPTGNKGAFSADSGYTLGIYVGFDDNKKMQHKGFKGFGGTVSLDAWIMMANAIAGSEEYVQKVDFLDLDLQVNQKVPLDDGSKIRIYKVMKANGLQAENLHEETGEFSSFYIRED